MAEDLGNAIVAAAEKMQRKEKTLKFDMLKELEAFSSERNVIIRPLYEHNEKCYNRNSKDEEFKLCSFKTWFTCGFKEKTYTDMFDVASDAYCNGLGLLKDKNLEKLFIGYIVEKISIEKETTLYEHYVEKRIVGLYCYRRRSIYL